MSDPSATRVAITMGDPAGIGPEIVLKALAAHPDWCARCVVLGDLEVLRQTEQSLGLMLPLTCLVRADHLEGLPPRCVAVMPTSELAEVPTAGAMSVAAAAAAGAAIERAVHGAMAGDWAAVVTAPIHKEAMHAAGVRFPGHTEWLQARAAAALGVDVQDLPVRMMLSNRSLRVVLLSVHVALHDAIRAVTQEAVERTLNLIARHLPAPQGRRLCMAVAGLNPHAGEGGLFGREELDIIAPAVQRMRAEGLDVTGPLAPDTVFMRASAGEFDVVLAMYHDQGLIPVKLQGLAHGVNTTLGLPFVRTSPDHGTAFDRAGRGVADPSSMVAALTAAFEMLEWRRGRQVAGR